MPPKTAKKSRTYIWLKSSKISTRRPIAKQGKSVSTTGSSTALAARIARKRNSSSGNVYLYRKGKLMVFEIRMGRGRGRKTSKLCFVAKKVKTIDVKAKIKKVHKKTRKPKRKTRKSRKGKKVYRKKTKRTTKKRKTKRTNK